MGMALKSVLLAYTGGTWLMIVWLWIRTRGDPAYVIYAIAANLIMALAMIPDVRNIIDRRRRGVSGSYAGAMEVTPMGRGITKLARRLGLMQEKDQAIDG